MNKKLSGLLTLLVIYVVSFLVGYGSFLLLEDKVPVIYNLLIADVIVTIFVWVVGIIFKTASILISKPGSNSKVSQTEVIKQTTHPYNEHIQTMKTMVTNLIPTQ